MTNPSGAVAALDCGTNSTRLLIVDAAGATMVRKMRITRLGEGVDATGRLLPAAMARSVSVLQDYRALMDREGVTRSRLVATSAVRDAENGDEFLRAAAVAVGTEAELLSGQEEGRLSYLGATAELSRDGQDYLVVDIGGGSTELAVPDHGAVASVSIELGCVRLTERFFRRDPPTEREVAACIDAIRAELEGAEESAPPLAKPGAERQLVGLAGTVSTLTTLELGLPEYDRSRVHHAVLTRSAVRRWCATLAAESGEDRARRVGMLHGRQDVILGGALVLQEIMLRFEHDECLVSEADILDGLAASLR